MGVSGVYQGMEERYALKLDMRRTSDIPLGILYSTIGKERGIKLCFLFKRFPDQRHVAKCLAARNALTQQKDWETEGDVT